MSPEQRGYAVGALLAAMKTGDRVRITVDGEVRDVVSGAVRLKLDGANYGVKAQDTVWIDFDSLTAPTAYVEVLPPPIDPDLLLARDDMPSLEWIQEFANNNAAGAEVGTLAWNLLCAFRRFAAIKAAKAGGKA